MVFGRPHRAILLCSQATGAAAVVAGGTYSIPEAFLTFGLSDSPPALRALTRRTDGDGRTVGGRGAFRFHRAQLCPIASIPSLRPSRVDRRSRRRILLFSNPSEHS